MQSYFIQLDDFYLTADGAENTKPCRLEVDLPPNFLATFQSNPRVDMKGNVFVEYTENPEGSNKQITITVQSLPLAVGRMIEEAKNESDSTGEDITLTAEHPTDSEEDFTLTGKILGFRKGLMSPSRNFWRSAEIVFLSTGVPSP